MKRKIAEIDAAIDNVLLLTTANFTELVHASGLDPSSAFRFADLSFVDFSAQDIRGYDFTGAKMGQCKFEGCLLAGAKFDRADVDQEALRLAKDWAEVRAGKAGASYSQKADVEITPRAITSFEVAFKHFSALAKVSRLRSETIAAMFAAAPSNRDILDVYEVCKSTYQGIGMQSYRRLAGAFPETAAYEWLAPFVEQFLMPHEIQSGDAKVRATVGLSNVIDKFYYYGLSFSFAVATLFEYANNIEEALSLLNFYEGRAMPSDVYARLQDLMQSGGRTLAIWRPYYLPQYPHNSLAAIFRGREPLQ